MSNKKQHSENTIQLELPDYSKEYEEWLRKKQETKPIEETVIIIDIY